MTRNWKVSYLNIFKFNLPDKLKDILISDITAIWTVIFLQGVLNDTSKSIYLKALINTAVKYVA